MEYLYYTKRTKSCKAVIVPPSKKDKSNCTTLSDVLQ